jgi:hypothetical protein
MHFGARRMIRVLSGKLTLYRTPDLADTPPRTPDSR